MVSARFAAKMAGKVLILKRSQQNAISLDEALKIATSTYSKRYLAHAGYFPKRDNMNRSFDLGFIVLAAAIAVANSPASAQVATTYDAPTAPTLAATWAIGKTVGIHANAGTPGAVYSNDTNFSGYAVNAGANGTTKFTALLADDINTTATSSFTLGQFTWSISNTATVAQTISPSIRFFATDGAGGGPGTYLGGLNFNGISVSAGTVSALSYDASASVITLTPSFWACEFFSTTGTAANAAKIGEGTFNPVDVGSSADEDFTSSTVSTSNSSFAIDDPAGTVNVSPFAGTPVANFEWEFNPATPTPEPASLGLLTTTAMFQLCRRRRSD
jgi:hypothetical protein